MDLKRFLLDSPLARDADGSVAIRWFRFFAFLAMYATIALTVVVLLGMRLRPTIVAFVTICSVLPWVLLVYLAKRQAEGKSGRQFSLYAMLVAISVACVLFALLGSDRRADLEARAHRERLQEEIMSIVGQGHVYVSSTTLIQVKRPAFDDDDLARIMRLKDQLDASDAPLTFLDLSDTSVTDRGVGALANVESLEYLFLDRTAVSDRTIDAVKSLPNLKLLSTWSTRVTPERLLNLGKERPGIDIEPKTAQDVSAAEIKIRAGCFRIVASGNRPIEPELSSPR